MSRLISPFPDRLHTYLELAASGEGQTITDGERHVAYRHTARSHLHTQFTLRSIAINAERIVC